MDVNITNRGNGSLIGAAMKLAFRNTLNEVVQTETFEEGTHSAWLHDLLVRRVAKLVVCNPRKNTLLKAGNKGDPLMLTSSPSCCALGFVSGVSRRKQRAG